MTAYLADERTEPRNRRKPPEYTKRTNQPATTQSTGAPAQPPHPQDPAPTRAGLETPWWGATPNITDAPPGARAFVLDAVQAAVGAVRITGTGISASVTTWEGAPCPMAAATNPLEALTSITLNPDRTVLLIPPRALPALRALSVTGTDLTLTNPDVGFTRTISPGALVLSGRSYSTLAVAIVG